MSKSVEIPLVPAIGIYRTDDHRYYWNGEGPYPGVTGILKVLDKPALAAWAKRETARGAITHWREVEDIVWREGPEAAMRYLQSVPGYERDRAASLGSRVHRLAELENLGTPSLVVDPEERPYLDAYRRWIADYQPEILAAEAGVISEEYRYGGTLDLIAALWRGPGANASNHLIDIKTSKGVYRDTALQLAAYAGAEFVGLPDDPQRYALPFLDAYAVLHLRPDKYPERGYRLIEYDVNDATFSAFLAARELSEWATSKPIMDEVPIP